MEEFFSTDLYDHMAKMTHTRTQYYVLGHGDCWTPNFLFKYEATDNLPFAAKMIDFQLARFASPALDIMFFIYSCTTQELRESHFDDLLMTYHQSVGNIIQSFGSDVEKVFPYSALMSELKEFGSFGVGMGIDSIPCSVMDDVSDSDEIIGDEAVPIVTVWILKPIQNKEGRRRLADMFKHAVSVGFI